MSVARVIEISSTSPQSFEEAIREGIARASETIRGIQGAWIKEQHVVIVDGRIAGYRVNMLVTFVLDKTEHQSQRVMEAAEQNVSDATLITVGDEELEAPAARKAHVS